MNAEDNPFPSVPIARLSGSYDLLSLGNPGTAGAVTVETDAIHAARAQLEAHLGQGRDVPSRGRALALVGDLGTGKSHIARDLARAVTTHPAAPLLWVVDEPVWDFGALYRDRLTSGLKDQKASFYDVLLDYYSDVTAESIDRSRSLREVADGLRERKLDPQAVIEAYALSETAIRRDLESRLQQLTEHKKFSAALALFQFPGFQDAVWEWLMGHPPSPILHERGIDTAIDTVGSVFDALSVFALLYGQTGRRFVLIIDMLEKVLEWPFERRTNFMQSFEKLVNVYVSVGGLLVFCVLPDALSELGESLHERIRPIWTTPLTDRQAVQLVHAYLHPMEASDPYVAANGGWADVAPFTLESVHYIRTLAGGVPRRVLKLCHHAWALATRESGEVPRAIDDVAIRASVRETFELVTLHDIRASIAGLLETGSWRFETSATRFAHRPGGEAESVDYWILAGQTGSAIALVTTDSVVLDSQVDRLEQVVDAARADTESAPCEVLVVVNGYISAPLRQRLAKITDTQPIVYSDRRFQSAMREAIRDLAARLESAGRDELLEVIQQRMEGLAYQQTSVIDYLQRIDSRVDRLDVSSSARLGELLQITADSEFAQPGSGPAARVRPARTRLPQEVQQHFDRAFDAVGLMSGVPATLRQVFHIEEGTADRTAPRPRRLAFTAEQFQAVGVAVLLQKLLEAFNDSVGDWMRQTRSGGPGTSPTATQERRLRTICRSYEITAEMLPVFRLESLAAFGPFTEGPEPLDQASRSFHRAEAEEALARLGERVLASAMACARA